MKLRQLLHGQSTELVNCPAAQQRPFDTHSRGQRFHRKVAELEQAHVNSDKGGSDSQQIGSLVMLPEEDWGECGGGGDRVCWVCQEVP